MKTTRTKKILSILLAVMMVVGTFPFTNITVNAAGVVQVTTWDELTDALQTAGSATIRLMNNINKTVEILPYQVFGDTVYDEIQVTVAGEKTLDMNGYSIEVDDRSNVAVWSGYYRTYQHCCHFNRTLVVIPADASLTIEGTDDTVFSYDGYALGSESYSGDQCYNPAYRDIFDVSGSLCINGGKFIAGSVNKKWTELEYYKDTIYTGYARRYINGTVANVKYGAKLVINAGTFYGHGKHIKGEYEDDCLTVLKYNRDSVIKYDSGSKVIVNGGSFIANGGANVFEGEGNLTIHCGNFKTDKNDKELGNFNKIPNIGLVEGVYEGTYGNLGIPDSAWKSAAAKMQIIKNGEIVSSYSQDLNETGGQSSGASLEVSIAPHISLNETVYLNGGIYNDYIISDGQTIDWNASTTDPLIAKVDYKPYYADTINLRNYTVNYHWRLYNSIEDFEYETTTTTNSLDISEATGDIYFKGVMSVSCTVEEKADNLLSQYHITSHADKFIVNTTRTPLDKTSLPGKDMKVNISYPDYSGSGSDIVINVLPTANDLKQNVNGSCTVRYEYTYRDLTSGKEFTDSLNNDEYALDWLDWGHVPISVTMIVYGSDGIAKRFTEDSWALKLPDIVPSGGDWNSDKTIFIANEGTPINLKAPIDVTNSAVPSDNILKNEICGWYKITYDEYGQPVYNQVGDGDSLFLIAVSKNGDYCYGAIDRNGDIVYSKPVKIQFSADGYSIKIDRFSDYNFCVNGSTGECVADATINATVGDLVSSTDVRWQLVRCPQGGEEFVNSTPIIGTGLSKKISKLFTSIASKRKNIIPGKYVFQAVVYKNSQYIAYSNTLTIFVDKISDFVEIANESGDIISGKTIEGSYVGTTMQLECVPGNNGNLPEFESINWSVESLVGTDVATINNEGVLTANKPGQVKVTAIATVANGHTPLTTNSQSVIINIPITEIEVTLDTPVIGGDPDKIASVPEDAPYKLVYRKDINWVSGIHPDTGLFYGTLVPELSVNIEPKDGYVFPARQLNINETVSDDYWWTYSDDISVIVNGEKYKFRNFEEKYTYGNTWDNVYGSFDVPQEIYFYWKWNRLRDKTHTYLNYVNLKTELPQVGDVKANLKPVCTNSGAIYSYGSGIYKVSGDYLNDNDISNDNAVSMTADETFQKGQIYRTGIYLTTNNNNNYTTHFAENVLLNVNGTRCNIQKLDGSTDLEGSDTAVAYLYFMPEASVQIISVLTINDLYEPLAFQQPISADDVNDFSSDYEIGDEVYVSRLVWFFDENYNNAFDEGEDSPEHFNANGSFVENKRYSVYLEVDPRDRDNDGKGDYFRFSYNFLIQINTETNGIDSFSGDQYGAVYKFPATKAPEYALMTDINEITFNMQKGESPEKQSVTFESMGTDEISAIYALVEDESILTVKKDGMSLELSPASDLEAGGYHTSVKVYIEESDYYYILPVIINVNNPGVKGIVTSGSGSKGQITVKLCKPGETSSIYSTIIKENNAEYSIPEVEEGAYNMIVTKAGHMPYCTTIEVNGKSVVHNVELQLFADTNCDGEVNAQDYQELINTILSDDHEQVETEEYDDLIHYDLVMDGYLDVLDAAVMALVVNGHKAIDKIYDIKKGDYDYDGSAFTKKDIILMENCLFDIAINSPKMTTAQKFAADLNYNGKIDNEDYDLVYQMYREL